MLFSDYWNRHDMQAFSELFAEDAEFVNVVGMWWKGRDAIRRAHEKTHASLFRNSVLTMSGIEVRFRTPDAAVARSRWRLEGHANEAGEALPPRNGILMNVVVRKQDGWKIVDSQNTDIIEGVLAPSQKTDRAA